MSSNQATEIRYEKPEDWLKWKPAFERLAKPSRVWQFIDPEGTEEFPSRPPRMTKISDFRRLVTHEDIGRQRQTRSQTVDSSDQALVVGERHPFEKAEIFPQLHPEDREILKQAADLEAKAQREYNEILRDQQTVAAYMNKTVSEDLQAHCMNDYPSIREQYKQLAARGQRAVNNNKKDRRDQYKNAVAPLRNWPKDFPAWVNNWENAYARAAAADVAETKDANTWFEDLITALKPVAENLTGHLRLSLDARVKSNTLTFNDASDLILTWLDTQPKRARPAKLPVRGAFHTNRPNDEDSSSEAEGAFPALEIKKRDRSPRSQKGRGGRGGAGGSRSGSQAGKRRPRDKDDEEDKDRGKRRPRGEEKGGQQEKSGQRKSCLFCSQFHGVACFYVFPDEAPNGWAPNDIIKKHVEALLKSSGPHKAAYERLQKNA